MNDVTISRSALSALVTQALNPQPLPPKDTFGPLPEPWLWSEVARQVIAGIIIVGGSEGRAPDEAASLLQRIVDEYCGTPPRRPIIGPRGPVMPDTLHATNLLAMAAQFQHAADTFDGHELQGAFTDAATIAFEAAARQG
jgi:hypothetical protein